VVVVGMILVVGIALVFQQPQSKGTRAILLFDGVCQLCNGFVNFVIDRDSEKNIRFLALQSEKGKKMLSKIGRPDLESLNTMVLIENEDEYFTHSTAVLRTLALMDAPWSFLYPLIVVPQFIRDSVYDVVSQTRYQIFGRDDVCRPPSSEVKDRFEEFD